MNSHYPFAADGRANWPQRDALLRGAGRAGARRCGDRARAARHRRARAAAAQPGDVRQAGGIDRRRPARAGSSSDSAPAGWRRSSTRSTPRSSAAARQLAEWIAIARECWTGTPAAHAAPTTTPCLRTSSACRRRHTESRSCWAATRRARWLAPGRSPTAGLGQQTAGEFERETRSAEARDAVDRAPADEAGRDGATAAHRAADRRVGRPPGAGRRSVAGACRRPASTR